jgi:hypothetical protein
MAPRQGVSRLPVRAATGITTTTGFARLNGRAFTRRTLPPPALPLLLRSRVAKTSIGSSVATSGRDGRSASGGGTTELERHRLRDLPIADAVETLESMFPKRLELRPAAYREARRTLGRTSRRDRRIDELLASPHVKTSQLGRGPAAGTRDRSRCTPSGMASRGLRRGGG